MNALLHYPVAADTSAEAGAIAAHIEPFLAALSGRNYSRLTIAAYRTDLTQFVTWLSENSMAQQPRDITRTDVEEFLSSLARTVTGKTRARKLAALREWFSHLEEHDVIDRSPAATIRAPKREKTATSFLHADEYTKLLSLAGSNPRDYALFQVLLQAGLRVSELCALTKAALDLDHGLLTVASGKGQQSRTVPLAKIAVTALKTYLRNRPESLYDRLFLNRYGEPLSRRGVEKLVKAYVTRAGLSPKVSVHSLRHTFGSEKYAKGVPLLQIQAWLGHKNVSTTQVYVHLKKQDEQKVMEATSL